MDTSTITFNDIPKLMGDMYLQMQKMVVKIDSLEARTKQLSDEKAESNPHRPLTTEQVCKLVHRKKDTVYKLARAGEIPCYRKGKFLEFFEDEILAWLSESKVVTAQQAMIDAEAYCHTHRL